MNPVSMLLDSRQELLCLLDHDLHWWVLYKWRCPELGTAAKVTWRQSQQTAPKTPITWQYWPRSVSSVAQSCPTLCNPMNCSTPSLPIHHQPWSLSNSCALSWWCLLTISSSVILFSSHLQSFPAPGSFPVSQFFTSGVAQNTRVSASVSVLPMNTQDWFPLGWTSWISLQSKGLSRVFSNTTVRKHQFVSAQLSL